MANGQKTTLGGERRLSMRDLRRNAHAVARSTPSRWWSTRWTAILEIGSPGRDRIPSRVKPQVVLNGKGVVMNDPEPGSLLIVDDEEPVRDALSRRLERRGYRVTTCSDGHRALDLIREGHFDLVLLGIMMPGFDGFQVLEALCATHHAAELPVITVTAKHESGDIVRALELGANDFVSKPIDFPVVLARIQTQLALRRC